MTAIYYAELETLSARMERLELFHTFTRVQPPGCKGYARRTDRHMLGEVAKPLGRSPQVFICGPTQLVESAYRRVRSKRKALDRPAVNRQLKEQDEVINSQRQRRVWKTLGENK